MALNKSEIGQFVHEEATSLRLKPPLSIVMVTHMSLNQHGPGNTRGKSPIRDGFSWTKTNHLGVEIIQEELREMFPSQMICISEVDFAKCGRDSKTESTISNAGIIMVSPYAMDIKTVSEISDRYPNKPIIAGGPFVTRSEKIFHEKTNNKCLAVLGRVEGSIPQVLHHIQENNYQGQTVKRKHPFNAVTDYHRLPRMGVVFDVKNNPTGVLFEAGEGCDEVCKMCAVLLHVKSDRNPLEAREELERLHQQGVKYVFFVDNDISRRSPELLETLFEYLDKNNMGWVGVGSRKILEYPDLAKLMGKTNILFLHGIDDVLTQVSTTEQYKSRSLDQIKSDLESLQQYRFIVFGSAVLGMDDHTYPGTFISMANYLKSISIPTTIHMVLPFPGTQLYTELDRAGRIQVKDFSIYTYGEPTFKPLNMSQNELLQGIRWTQRELADPRIIANIITLVVRKAGREKFVKFPRAIASVLLVAIDNGLIGLNTHPDNRLQNYSESIINKIWGLLPNDVQSVLNQI